MPDKSAKDKGCDVALLVDVETGERDACGRFVPDADCMESDVLHVLSEQHERVAVVPFESRLDKTVCELRSLQPRLVFNLTEWIDGDRRLDAAIASVLEAMKVPYTGTGPAGMHLARDKALAKALVAALGVTVPRHVVLDGRRTSHGRLAFPLIVKPQFGDGSDEIAKQALVRTPRELERRVKAVRGRTRMPLLAEEYVPGCDLFVGLLGNKPRVLQPLEMVVGRRGTGAPAFATWRVKSDERYQAKWAVHYRPAMLPRSLQRDVERTSVKIFHTLQLRDYARIDYRLTPEQRLVFIEANPNPDLSPDTFGENRCFAGVAYDELIGSIVKAALKRHRRRKAPRHG